MYVRSDTTLAKAWTFTRAESICSFPTMTTRWRSVRRSMQRRCGAATLSTGATCTFAALKCPRASRTLRLSACVARTHSRPGVCARWDGAFLMRRAPCKSASLRSTQALLGQHPARHFRLFCLQHHYASNVDYNDDRMRDAAVLDKRLAHFFAWTASAQQNPAWLELARRREPTEAGGDGRALQHAYVARGAQPSSRPRRRANSHALVLTPGMPRHAQ